MLLKHTVESTVFILFSHGIIVLYSTSAFSVTHGQLFSPLSKFLGNQYEMVSDSDDRTFDVQCGCKREKH